jgi:hypothetical protein
MLKKTIKVTINCPEIQNGACQTPSDIFFDFYINNKLIFSELHLKNTFIEYSYETDFDVEKTNVLKLLSSSKNIEDAELQADVVDVNEFIISPNANYIKDINKVYDLLITDLDISCHCPHNHNTQDLAYKGKFKKDYFLNDKLKGTLTEYCIDSEDNNSKLAQKLTELAYLWNYTDKLSFKIIESYRPFNSHEKQGLQDLADKYTLTINLEII